MITTNLLVRQAVDAMDTLQDRAGTRRIADLPVIDVAGLPDDPSALAAIDAACRTWGCFLIRGFERVSELDASLLRAFESGMHAFFALPSAQRHAIERTAQNTWGYYDRELTKNTRDWKEIFDVGPESGANVPQWPGALPGFRPLIERYYRACESLAFPLLRALSACLGMPAAHLDPFFAGHTSFLRLNHYPPCPVPAGPDDPSGTGGGTTAFGINHHTDAGALTLLFQDRQPGLQLFRDGSWYLVEPLPGTLTVNIGDIVQVWSNDRYAAPLHRVLANSTATRYSAAFFFNPASAANYAPLPSLCAQEPPRYRPINWGAFRTQRAAGDYADLGTEIQISDFRLGR
jgi:isopenicillin N synthase-like dioxygenase